MRLDAFVCLAIAAPLAAAPSFKTVPTVSANPNPSMPLAAIVRFTPSRAVSTVIEVADGERRWRTEFGKEHSPAKGLPVLGLRPGRRHEMRVTIRDDSGTAVAPAPLVFQTQPLPSAPDFPPVVVRASNPAQMEPGITILSVRRQSRGGAAGPLQGEASFATRYGLLLGLDAAGQVVWYYRTDRRISGFKRLRNGNLIYITADNRAVEIDVLGNVHGEWYAKRRPEGPCGAVPVDTLTFHHAVTQASNGNIIVLGSEIREIDNYFTSETDPAAPRARQKVKGDEVIEFRRDGL